MCPTLQKVGFNVSPFDAVSGPNGDASLVVCGPNGDASLACLALIDWSTGVCAAQLFGSFEVLFPAQGIRGPPTTPGLAPPAWG